MKLTEVAQRIAAMLEAKSDNMLKTSESNWPKIRYLYAYISPMVTPIARFLNHNKKIVIISHIFSYFLSTGLSNIINTLQLGTRYSDRKAYLRARWYLEVSEGLLRSKFQPFEAGRFVVGRMSSSCFSNLKDFNLFLAVASGVGIIHFKLQK